MRWWNDLENMTAEESARQLTDTVQDAKELLRLMILISEIGLTRYRDVKLVKSTEQ